MKSSVRPLLGFVLAVCCALFSAACDDDSQEPENLIEEIDPMVEITRYCHDLSRFIKTMVIESDIDTSDVRVDSIAAFENLRAIRIVDADDRRVGFWNLSKTQQHALIDRYSKAQKKVLEEKLSLAPDLKYYLASVSTAIEFILEYATESRADVADPLNTMLELQRMVDSMKTSGGQTTRAGGIIGQSEDDDRVSLPFYYLKRFLVGKSRRGDLLIILAQHDNPLVIRNNGIRYDIGHTTILLDSVSSSTVRTDTMLVETNLKGVKCNTLEEMCYESYHLRLREFEYYMVGDEFEFREVELPVERFADRACSYIGTRFVHDSELTIAKTLAPKAFTCASLAWWCAKEEFGFSLAPWFSTMVSPSDIVLDDNTIVIDVID